MELNEAIKNRRSVRKFSDYYVTDDELKNILEAARMAPSWANTQAWEFVVVRNRDLITKVTETYSGTNPARSCSSDASALIVVCAKTGVSGCKNGEQRTKFTEWFMFDLGLAVQNLCLRAHDLGLGTVIVGSMDHDACARIIQLPVGYEVAAVVPVGKPMHIGSNVPARKELHSFVHLDKFSHPYKALGE